MNQDLRPPPWPDATTSFFWEAASKGRLMIQRCSACGGQLPLNTAGGQLAEGRLHAINLLNEAVLQLRSQCGARQVPNARVAVVACGLYMQCGAMILTSP